MKLKCQARTGVVKTLAAVAAIVTSLDAHAALTFTVDPNGWPNAAHRNAAVAAMQSAVNRYNAYGDFGNYNVWAYYNAGIPTAQANYLGAIGFGGTYPNERVTLHEMSHYLGTGTHGTPWDGPRAEATIDQFDGLEASLNGDSAHYWPYGLNFDNEGAEINKQRHVALLYAMRADMGIGSAANPSSWAATAVTLKAPDPAGTSGFNHASNWNDNTFAHPNAAYSTGAFSMRTPEGYNSWTFAGNSLTVNPGGRLLYNSWGTTGVVTIRNLIVNGGTVRHDQFPQDLFQLAGKVTLAGNATFEAANGNIKVSANIGGGGSLVKTGSHTLTLTGGNTYTGNTIINAGTLRLAPAAAVASYTFDNVSGSSVINAGTGGSAMNGILANGATIIAGGRFGNAVSLAGGASVNINNPIVDLGNNTTWTVSAWVRTSTPGASILTKGDGAGWAYGNTIFYLGDGTAGGSGGVPSAVRWAGGFFQGSTTARTVNDTAWHHVTYVNEGGNYAIYIDGAAQPLSPGNTSFSVPDIGTVVRLGVSTNTVPADGIVNFNGLLDSVQFYNQALSAPQIAALYQGLSVGPLPTTTNVTIASGATLDVNGITQQIASLTGPAGSAVTLGLGQLIVSSANTSQFAGTISGPGGSLVKSGTGTLTLSGNNTYTGRTTVAAGTLVVNGSIAASSAVSVQSGAKLEVGSAQTLRNLTLTGGSSLAIRPGGFKVLKVEGFAFDPTSSTDVNDNALVADYAPGGPSPLQAIRDAVRSGYNNGSWTGPGITSSAAAANGPTSTGVGFAEASTVLGPAGGNFFGSPVDATAVLVRYTLKGDASLDGNVNFNDLVTLAQNYNVTDGQRNWGDGDFTYDGNVGFTDLVALAQNYNTSLTPAQLAAFDPAFREDLARAAAQVPEPATAFAVAAAAAILAARRRQ